MPAGPRRRRQGQYPRASVKFTHGPRRLSIACGGCCRRPLNSRCRQVDIIGSVNPDRSTQNVSRVLGGGETTRKPVPRSRMSKQLKPPCLCSQSHSAGGCMLPNGKRPRPRPSPPQTWPGTAGDWVCETRHSGPAFAFFLPLVAMRRRDDALRRIRSTLGATTNGTMSSLEYRQMMVSDTLKVPLQKKPASG